MGGMNTVTSINNAGQIAAALRASRRESGLTRAQLSGMAGCSMSHLANLEAGAVPQSSAVLDRVRAVLADHDAGSTSRDDRPTAATDAHVSCCRAR